MNRLQKKCLVASMCGHIGLVGILLFASAFSKKAPPDPIMELVPVWGAKMTDGASHGGNPAPAAAAAPPAQEQPQQAQAAPPTPPPLARPPEPTPVAPDPVKPVLSENPRAEISLRDAKKEPPKKHVVQVNLKEITLKDKRKAEEEAAKESAKAEKAAQDAARVRAQRFASAIHKLGTGTGSAISSGLSGATLVSIGGSGGGEAFSNYRDAVFSAYYEAWIPPDDVSDETTTVARIVVARDGTIETFEIFHKSGKHSMDASVEAALRAVKQLPAFPEESKDLQRTFKIKFQPQAKQSLG